MKFILPIQKTLQDLEFNLNYYPINLTKINSNIGQLQGRCGIVHTLDTSSESGQWGRGANKRNNGATTAQHWQQRTN